MDENLDKGKAVLINLWATLINSLKKLFHSLGLPDSPAAQVANIGWHQG
jgi:hypothetical protein